MNLFTTQLNSPKGKLNIEDLKALGWNVIKYTAPVTAIFFAQLSMGINWRAAGLVALYALYALVSDFLKKLNTAK